MGDIVSKARDVRALFDLREHIMDVNVKGTFLCSREAAKVMRGQGDLFGVVFLASGASNFIHGAVIPVDGGAIAPDGFPTAPAL